jgi:hypothetical protein
MPGDTYNKKVIKQSFPALILKFQERRVTLQFSILEQKVTYLLLKKRQRRVYISGCSYYNNCAFIRSSNVKRKTDITLKITIKSKC